jgi:outer membrane protein OmpA-like peptidoglycan-associated protein
MRLAKGPAFLILVTAIVVVGALAAQDSDRLRRVPYGSETKVKGVIVERSGDALTIRDYLGGETRVRVTPGTEIKEAKKNPFRKSKTYSQSQLLLGLNVEAKGRGDQDGILVAEEIKFTQDDLEVAETITSRVAPVESDLEETQMSLEATQERLGEAEQRMELTAKQVQGQMEELDAAYRTARAEAGDAQRTADQALSGVDSANERISSLDDYDVSEVVIVEFGFDSSALTDEAESRLEQLALKCREEKGYLLEIVGYTSSDGNAEYNRRLSQRRADSVVRYLTEDGQLPLRRIITPHGFGAKNPVADNTTTEGRQKNRRVEVRVLVSRALVED